MEVTRASHKLYTPIRPYQTRVLRLLGDNGVPESPLVCRLYTADILHPKVGGVGVRAPSGEADDFTVEYDAVSYTWGSGETLGTLTCNDVDLPITENLFQALRILRRSQNHYRYLWVDAVCINQGDDEEKSKQVRNMLAIYDSATTVIAWLGDPHEGLEEVLSAASSMSLDQFSDDPFDVSRLCSAMSHLYARPWFQRIWVQQEAFAARNLVLQSGHLQFQWTMLLSTPLMLSTLPQMRTYRKYFLDEKKSRAKVPTAIVAQLDAIIRLDQLHTERLDCFERIRKQSKRPFDIVELLMHTGNLQATDPRDFIYGILGMTGFPTKAMSLHEWRNTERMDCIPIDYSADLVPVLCVVTKAMLMKGGLMLLAKFQTFSTDKNDTRGPPLPSWVIDWSLAAKVFQKKPGIKETITLDNVWFNPTDDSASITHTDRPDRSTSARQSKSKHAQFSYDNKINGLPFDRLILRGVVDATYQIRDNCIWEPRRLLPDRAIWRLNVAIYPTDLVVYVVSFADLPFETNDVPYAAQYRHFLRGGRAGLAVGPLLLRPTTDDEFLLIACLPWLDGDWRPLYSEWHPTAAVTAADSTESLQRQTSSGYRRLMADPAKEGVNTGIPYGEGFNPRRFIIA